MVTRGGWAVVIAGLAWLVFGVMAKPDRGMVLLAEAPADVGGVSVVIDAPVDSTLAEARAWPESRWTRWTERGYLSAKHGFVIWARVTLKNPGPEPLHGVLEEMSYFSDRVEVHGSFGPDSDRVQVSGSAIAGEDKPLWTRMPAFPVTVPAGGERELWVRTSDPYLAHIQPVWWPRSELFFEAKTRHLLIQSTCFGALLALVFYNVVLWLRLRFTDTGYYVLTAGAGALCNFFANGGLAVCGIPFPSPWHETLVAGVMAIGMACMLKFARVFLGTAALTPRVDRWLRAWGVVLIGFVLTSPGMLWMTTNLGLSFVVLASVLTDLFCMAAAAWAWRCGARHARFFLAAYGFLLLAGIPIIMSVVHGQVGSGVAMALLVGRTLEMLLLSFAVADRFAQTQRRLFEETEQRRAIQEAYSDELEIEVRERTRELAEANADKDRMIAVIGHDLRSPLTVLTRTAEHLGGSEPTPPHAPQTPQSRFIGDAAQLGRQVLLLIEDLVLWARLRAGTIHLATQPVRGLIEPVVRLHQPLAGQRGLELRMSGEMDSLPVTTDLVLAQTLLRNLVANALRYARTHVEVSVATTPTGVCLSVIDDGPGLPPEVAARLSGDNPSTDWAGHGLGLRLCMEIGRTLNAGLEVASARNGGTAFSFTLPKAGPAPVASTL